MPRPAPKPRQPPLRHVETVGGAWLFKAIAGVIAAAVLCTYLTLCVLFYRGQWQAVLHPVRSASSEASGKNLIHFDPGDSARPQLVGEWMAAAPDSRYGGLTILLLPGGDGNRESFSETAKALQQLGVNVFSFDYRGYGQSANLHPSQQRMTEDSEAAWNYLTGIRGVSASAVLPYGIGVGASLAVHLASQHAGIRGIFLESPHGDFDETIRQDSRLRLLPTGLLFHETFPVAGPLSELRTPKLLISVKSKEEPAVFKNAAAPKILVSLPASSGALFEQAVTRFLDQYLAVSSPAPSDTKVR